MASERKKVMLVDDNPTNLTAGKSLLKDSYMVYPVPSAAIMFELLGHIVPDMILLDIEMPEMNGYEAIKKLKMDIKFSDIPVIFLTSRSDVGSEFEGLNLGAIDYISKPFSGPLLIRRIENHLCIQSQKKELKEFTEKLTEMVKERTDQIITLQNAVLSTVANLVEFRDDETGGHIYRTQKFLEILLERMIETGVYKEETADWDMAYLLPSAKLHDVGKIGISDLILNKPGRLTSDEFSVMKTHVEIGVKAIRKIELNSEKHVFLRHARLIAGTHHEKWDGTGYPAGLAGTDIPLEGRLMAIVDVYDALVSRRPYKEPIATNDAQINIERGRGTHFDPVLVDIFREVADKFADVANKYLEEEALQKKNNELLTAIVE